MLCIILQIRSPALQAQGSPCTFRGTCTKPSDGLLHSPFYKPVLDCRGCLAIEEVLTSLCIVFGRTENAILIVHAYTCVQTHICTHSQSLARMLSVIPLAARGPTQIFIFDHPCSTGEVLLQRPGYSEVHETVLGHLWRLGGLRDRRVPLQFLTKLLGRA